MNVLGFRYASCVRRGGDDERKNEGSSNGAAFVRVNATCAPCHHSNRVKSTFFSKRPRKPAVAQLESPVHGTGIGKNRASETEE